MATKSIESTLRQVLPLTRAWVLLVFASMLLFAAFLAWPSTPPLPPSLGLIGNPFIQAVAGATLGGVWFLFVTVPLISIYVSRHQLKRLLMRKWRVSELSGFTVLLMAIVDDNSGVVMGYTIPATRPYTVELDIPVARRLESALEGSPLAANWVRDGKPLVTSSKLSAFPNGT